MTHERVQHSGKLLLTAEKFAPALAREFANALKYSGMEVFSAFILMARHENEPKPHLLFLIDFNGDRKLLFPRVAKAIQPHMKVGTNFELLKANLPLLAQARAAAEPVFEA
jgi:hypothetical protein